MRSPSAPLDSQGDRAEVTAGRVPVYPPGAAGRASPGPSVGLWRGPHTLPGWGAVGGSAGGAPPPPVVGVASRVPSAPAPGEGGDRALVEDGAEALAGRLDVCHCAEGQSVLPLPAGYREPGRQLTAASEPRVEVASGSLRSAMSGLEARLWGHYRGRRWEQSWTVLGSAREAPALLAPPRGRRHRPRCPALPSLPPGLGPGVPGVVRAGEWTLPS